MSTETEHGTITKYNLQKMHAGPYPQKKDVDSIALNAYLYPLEAPTRERGCTNSTLETHAPLACNMFHYNCPILLMIGRKSCLESNTRDIFSRERLRRVLRKKQPLYTSSHPHIC